MSHVCKSLYELLIDNRNSAENDILRLLKDVREYW